MKKIRLDVDTLRVESFEPGGPAASRGTVHGHVSLRWEDCLPTETEDAAVATCAPTDQSCQGTCYERTCAPTEAGCATSVTCGFGCGSHHPGVECTTYCYEQTG